MNHTELSRGARQLGWTSCLTSAGRVTDNISSYKHFGSPNRDNSWRSECHEMLRLRAYSRNLYQRSEFFFSLAKPTHLAYVNLGHAFA